MSAVLIMTTNTEGVTRVLGRSENFTGRTVLWSSLVPYILNRPIQGYGYSAFWVTGESEAANIERIMGTAVMYSHNGYVEVLLGLGAIGFVLSLVFLGIGFHRAIFWSKLGHSTVEVWPLAVMVYFLIFNFGEATILIHSLQWALWIATVLGSDPVLFAPDEEEENEFPLVLAEEFK
jgi:exopolysaccharide production protein ExoQ